MIDYTYFKGDNHVAQLSTPAVLEKLNLYIKKYESEFFETVLGYKLNKEFQAGLLLDPIPDKWKNLRDGAEYTNRYGTLAQWKGFTDKETSPVSAYIYWHWVRSESKYLVGAGPVEAKTENSKRVNPNEFQVRAWNEMVQNNRRLAAFVIDNHEDYGDFGPYYYHTYYASGWQHYSCGSDNDSRFSFFETTNFFGI